MMFNDISQKLEFVFRKLRGLGKITEANIADSLREVRRVLLDAGPWTALHETIFKEEFSHDARRRECLNSFHRQLRQNGKEHNNWLNYDYVGSERRNSRFTKSSQQIDRKSTRLNSSHIQKSRMPSSA